jgi:hypothetical protein
MEQAISPPGNSTQPTQAIHTAYLLMWDLMLCPPWGLQFWVNSLCEQWWPKSSSDTVGQLWEILCCFPARITDLTEKSRTKFPLLCWRS